MMPFKKLAMRLGALIIAILVGFSLRYTLVSHGTVQTAAASEEPIEMVVLMYHSINSNPNRVGDYTITPDALRTDLEFLQREGYSTVVMADLIAYVHDGTPLPEKPVMITFDDGYYNNYLNAFPLLQEFNMKAVVSIICYETDRYSELEEKSEKYSHLTWPMIQEMMDSGLVEFQNHSYNLHKSGSGARKGIGKNQGESTQAYRESIGADLEKAQQRYTEMTGWTPTTFTYPFGTVSEDSYEVLRELGFLASLDAQGRVFRVSRDESCLWRIPRYNRPWGTSAEQIFAKAFAQKK